MQRVVNLPVDTSDWDLFARKLKEARLTGYSFYRQAAHELAARLLALVIPRTQVGQDTAETGKMGGTMRRGWVCDRQSVAENNPGTPSAMEMRAWAYSLPVRHRGNTYEITVSNPVEYASYVEYGHRQQPGRFVPAIGKRLKANWVDGQYMLTISEVDMLKIQPQVLERLLHEWLEGMFGNGK